MRRYGLFLVSAALVAAPAAAQTYGGSGSPSGYAGVTSAFQGVSPSAGIGDAPASYRSFFFADGPTQLAAHKARWARIEAKRQQRAKEKAERAQND